MSNNKSKNKGTLDKDMVQDESSAMNSVDQKSVSLKEYSKTAPFAFDAKNHKLLLLGLGINMLGFILMIGGATDDPSKFNGDELFSSVRITLSPLLIIIGYVIILYSIMKKNKPKTDSNN